MFKIDSNTKDDDIPKIRTVDILKVTEVKHWNKAEAKLWFNRHPENQTHMYTEEWLA